MPPMSSMPTPTIASARTMSLPSSLHTQTCVDSIGVISRLTGAMPLWLMPDAAKGATEGEVMAPMPGMPLADMPTTDAGHPVNHHLEVHLVNKSDGNVVTDTA